MRLSCQLHGQPYSFRNLTEVFGKANELKSGDRLAGVAAETEEERIAAKIVLSEITLADIRNHPLLPPEEDEVSRVIEEQVDESVFQRIRNWTVGQFREELLARDGDAIRQLSTGITAEMTAAVTKLLSNLDLMVLSKKLHHPVRATTTVGLPGRLSMRLQPNHPTDDPDGIIAATYDGLSLGAGDAVIGVNPVDESVEKVESIMRALDEVIQRWAIPTQTCVLAHVTVQMEAMRRGARTGLVFQSIAGTQAGNEAFGVDVALLDEANAMAQQFSVCEGPNVMYFETGEGSELSSEAHHGIDQLTLEARCYGLAKRYQPLLVNTVVGFIGPEYLYDGRQVTRAGLEDLFMGKLIGISMGCDACYTNHTKADQDSNENLAVLLAASGCAYFMSVPMADDCMLNYQSTSPHDGAALRELLGLRPAPEFDAWLEKMGITQDGRLTAIAGDPSAIFSGGVR